MTTATEQLQALADQWSQRLGGKIGVVLRLSVYAGPNNPNHATFFAEIGGDFSGLEKWRGFSSNLEQAQSESEGKWRADGAPIDFSDRNALEKLKLKVRAAELGLRIVEDEPNIDPVKDL